MDPATASLIAAGITAGGAIGGGMLAGGGQKETKIQKKQRHLIDDLILSLKGEGPFSDLYQTDEAAFQKSFVDPAKSMFRNQIAPQIQQSYIAGGQQRGTGLDDQLLRAGVDLDQLLNQHYMDFINQGQNRMQSSINSILGGGPGVAPQNTTGQNFKQATAGYLSSPAFSNSVSDIFRDQNESQTRRGFQKDLGRV